MLSNELYTLHIKLFAKISTFRCGINVYKTVCQNQYIQVWHQFAVRQKWPIHMVKVYCWVPLHIPYHQVANLISCLKIQLKTAEKQYYTLDLQAILLCTTAWESY